MQGTKLPDALGAVAVAIRPKLIRFFQHHVGHQDAEDCVQRTLLALLDSGGKDRHGRPLAAPEAFAWRIARRIASSCQAERRLRPQQMPDDADCDGGQSETPTAESTHLARRLVETMTTDPRYKDLLLQHTGWSVAELADRRGCREGSMGVALNRMRRRFWHQHGLALRELHIQPRTARRTRIRVLPPGSSRARG